MPASPTVLKWITAGFEPKDAAIPGETTSKAMTKSIRREIDMKFFPRLQHWRLARRIVLTEFWLFLGKILPCAIEGPTTVL
jgi:hypothetical protein